ncbi:MAG TPA: class I SAM-dependent rRNA methyltransferase [Elusimicrobiota bacterium]|nr:class I SAM-dependent rRNA methyltransferase [Elusimicrobiota bacterium]
MTTTALEYPSVKLKPKEEGRLLNGHLWAFSNEIAEPPDGVEPGALADLYHAGKGFIGRGFYHPNSLIAFRLLTYQKDDVIDESFFEKRFREALSLRERAYPGCSAHRWIFGESDRLPGLVVDRFGDYLSVQILSAGMERLKDVILAALAKAVPARGIVWRPDAAIRSLEGLSEDAPSAALGDIPERLAIELENGRFEVDLLGGQKTGFYFDQRDNRQALAALCRGRKVLDAFCYSGGFGIAAARAGAREVVFSDSSRAALELAEDNWGQNNLDVLSTFVEGDAAKLLEHESPGGPFDVVCVDPPAFARTKKQLPAALKAYEKLNSLAIGALPRGGIVATSSCSHHLDRETFVEMLRRASRKARRPVRLLELRGQAKDHPVLLAMPETEYLKFALLQVM